LKQLCDLFKNLIVMDSHALRIMNDHPLYS